jgi:hypothetical protein
MCLVAMIFLINQLLQTDILLSVPFCFTFIVPIKALKSYSEKLGKKLEKVKSSEGKAK